MMKLNSSIPSSDVVDKPRRGWLSCLFSSRKKDTTSKDQKGKQTIKSEESSCKGDKKVASGNRPSPTGPFASRPSPSNSFFSRASPGGRTSLGRISFILFRRMDSSARSPPSSTSTVVTDAKFFEADDSLSEARASSNKNSMISLPSSACYSTSDLNSPASPPKLAPEVAKVFIKPPTPKPPLPTPPQPTAALPQPTTSSPTSTLSSRTTAAVPAVNIIQLVRPRAHQNSNVVAIADDLPFEMDREVWKVEDYSHLEQIHSGYASSVYRAVCNLSRKKVVLKVYQPDLLHEISQFQLEREARIHVKLNHPNIIKMWAAFEQADGVVIVQEYADGGDLLKIMTENGMRLSESTASRMVIKPLLSALTYLHSKSIIHRDIKLENIIFDGPDMTLKLADFGLCVSLREERSVTRAGTLDYMAPEVLRCPTKDRPQDNKERLDLSYGVGVDIWSTGILAYELVNGVPPFTRHERELTERLILSGGLHSFLLPASEDCRDFVSNCLVGDGCLRPSATFCLKHPWITGLSKPLKTRGTQSNRPRRETCTDGFGDLDFQMHNEMTENPCYERGSQLKKRQESSSLMGEIEEHQTPQTRSPSPIQLINPPDPLSKAKIPDKEWKSKVLAAATKETDQARSNSTSIQRFMAEGFRSTANSPTLIRSQIQMSNKDFDDELEVPDI